MRADKKIIVATITCVIVALASWGFALISTLFFDGDSTSAPVATEVASEATTSVQNDSFYEHGLIETDDFSIQITGYKIINPGEEGNKYESMPVIGFWYDVTNNSGREISASSAWIYCIRAIQDNDPSRVNELNMASSPDSRYIDTQSENIKTGGTVSNAVAYTLTDTTTPVTLKATDGIVGDEIGERTFELRGVRQQPAATQATPAQTTGTPQPEQFTQATQATQATQSTQTTQTQ